MSRRGNPATDPRDDAGRYWLQEFLLVNGDLVDIVSIHRYPFPRSMAGPSTTTNDLQLNSQEWDAIIPNLRAIIRETTGDDKPVAVTEVNSDWTSAIGGEATPDSYYNAIWWADVSGRLIRQRAEIVAHFSLQSGAGIGGRGLFGRFDIRPTYYVYQLYQRFGETLIEAAGDVEVSIYAALREDGALTLIVVNMSDEDQVRDLDITGFATGGVEELLLLDQSHNAEPALEQLTTEDMALDLPPQSAMLVILTPE